MTTSNQQNNVCIICGKTAGMFTCNGCSKTFCLYHTDEHRQVLEKQINEIISNHNRLKQDVIDGKSDPWNHTLMKQIDQWEQQSIQKIHQTAKEIRHQLTNHLRAYHDNIKQNFISLTQQLTKARDDGNYFENDLKQWKDMLHKLQHTYIQQQNIEIHQVSNIIPFISRISLVETTNYGLKQLKYKTNQKQPEYHVNLNIHGDYSSGDHRLRFQLEQYQPTSRILIGIISKDTSKYIDPYNNPTFYGWTKHNLVYLHGVAYLNYNNYQNDIEKDDIFQLILDCNQRMIRLINERTANTFEINVDISKCPFPWQPHIRLVNN